MEKKPIPKNTQEEIDKIVSLIKKGEGRTDFILLYGSYARGDWVEDKYVEDRIVYEYESDLDILILVANEKLEKDFSIWNRIEAQVARDRTIKTPVSLEVDTVQFFNDQIAAKSYFYSDIRKEAVILYDSGKQKLEDPRELPHRRKKEMIIRDKDLWLDDKAEEAFVDFENIFKRGNYKKAVFELHQATEALYTTVLLVFSGYKPKTHDLKKLRRRVNQVDPRFKDTFPENTDEDKRLFQLLTKAYVDARYKPSYTITKEELEVLKKKAIDLKDLVKKLCNEKLNGVEAD
tara:strand:- start:450 stop:1319 length:870 start_codon:yes stop_codon:yes gene_type:complete